MQNETQHEQIIDLDESEPQSQPMVPQWDGNGIPGEYGDGPDLDGNGIPDEIGIFPDMLREVVVLAG